MTEYLDEWPLPRLLPDGNALSVIMMGTEDPEGGTEQVLGPADPEKNRLSPDRVLGRLLAPPEINGLNQSVR